MYLFLENYKHTGKNRYRALVKHKKTKLSKKNYFINHTIKIHAPVKHSLIKHENSLTHPCCGGPFGRVVQRASIGVEPANANELLAGTKKNKKKKKKVEAPIR